MDYIEPPDEARELATQLDHVMRKAGFERWELCGVADRRLVTELREAHGGAVLAQHAAVERAELAEGMFAEMRKFESVRNGDILTAADKLRHELKLTRYALIEGGARPIRPECDGGVDGIRETACPRTDPLGYKIGEEEHCAERCG